MMEYNQTRLGISEFARLIAIVDFLGVLLVLSPRNRTSMAICMQKIYTNFKIYSSGLLKKSDSIIEHSER